ncbi:hypothetical protein PCIT_a3029 [Pseudoalteromonas citrea]|uniref:Uncharacterized protein n=2 Tax=Pseudoalteromonas citrea TaxID=43655 RepID=A0AAD4AI52_9GAMM|nr:hypothetical protein [Pseudoalteromonas citrea]KAF7770076.1 hypothetical protein PCIT_a3029 [Pseudoalteromonas citrea]
MSDLQNIADLVSVGNELLDDIRGGAISKMQKEHDDKQAVFKSEHDATQSALIADTTATVNDLKSRVGDVVGQMPFTAINKNHDFLNTTTFTTSSGVTHTMPVGMGIKSPAALKTSVVNVRSGSTPEARDPVVIELLNYIIGANPKYFSSHFNVLKVEVLDADVIKNESYNFHIPAQHMKSPSSFMAYYKLVSDKVGYLKWLGTPQDNSWSRKRQVFKSNALNYVHVDIKFHSDVQNGDVLYLALPTIVVGNYPDVNHGVLYSNHKIDY